MKPLIRVLASASRRARAAGCCLLLMALLQPLAAQDKEEGSAFIYDEVGGDVLFATHSTYPFGTRLIVTNPVFKVSVTVQIGGRPDPARGALLELSPQAAEALQLPPGYPTWVFVEPAPEERQAPKKHVMRARMGIFRQSGNATVRSAGNDLTASHTSLPIGTKVKITYPAGGKETVVTINSRIPASAERVIEVSRAAGQALGISSGAAVQLESVNN